ncbi:DUF317 domain-containing protein [Streptomyces sp. YIM 98790]|uniref:DUF317 domain-containing protein n=1 Tax=Streptomyces sp. YIM 98790 TaxID=2689077 RepID=UPI00140A783C|nr:DUF317 domain-containing protein [Streptomyces sp. YIM 98790]
MPATGPAPRDGHRRVFAVTPRYLAGPSDSIAFPAAPLVGEGWSHQEDPQTGTAVFTSPDHRLRLGYRPGTEGENRWTFTGWDCLVEDDVWLFGQVAWIVEFDPATPPEIVRSFATRLADLHAASPEEVQSGPSWPLGDALAPLVAAGWQQADSPTRIVLRSPDEQATLVCRREAPRRSPGRRVWATSGSSASPAPTR